MVGETFLIEKRMKYSSRLQLRETRTQHYYLECACFALSVKPMTKFTRSTNIQFSGKMNPGIDWLFDKLELNLST